MLSKMLRGSVNNTTNPTNSDPNFKQVSLLLHGDGTNGAQNNTFLDSSTNNFTVTRNGNTTQGSNTPFSQADGYWSNYNTNTSSYLTIATNAAFTYGLNDFTIECWINLTATGILQIIIDQRNSGTSTDVIPTIYVSASNVLIYFVSGADRITGTTALTVGIWYHVAVSRSTLNTKMFLNGVQEGSTYTDANNYVACQVVIGALSYTSYPPVTLVGYFSNVRIVKGTAVYTSAFTPPTTPLTAITNTSLLTCQSNYFKDNSSNNFTLTATGTPSVQPFSPFAPTSAYSTSVNGGSMYFDGTGDYLELASNAAFQFGTGDFTVETWIYGTSLAVQNTITDFRPSGTNGAYLLFGVKTTGALFIVVNGADQITSSAGAIAINTWNHVAVSRSGTSTKMFINGIQAGSTYTDTTNYLLAGIRIGQSVFGGYPENFNGYISSLRTVNGTAVYTANFTPPTAPLTAITNTQLLLSGTNAGIYDNAIKNDLETVGSAQVSTSVKKYGTGSMYFAGGTDYFTLPSTPNLAMGSGDFTWELWVYVNSFSSFQAFIDSRTSTNGEGLYFGINYNSNAVVIYDNGNAPILTSSTTLTASTWTHIALVRNAGTLTLYFNGVSVGSVANTFNLSSTKYSIGIILSVLSYSLNGYIDDLRITKGVARYTANFTPPTAAFPNQ
jgi:hypothetical protein